MSVALASRDMGAVMRTYRTHPYHGRDIPQDVAAAWVGITQARLSRIENGSGVSNISKLTQWASVLRIPPDLLWFAMSKASAQPSGRLAAESADQEATCHIASTRDRQGAARVADTNGIDDVNRRELLRLVSMAGAAMALNATGDSLDMQQFGGTAPGRLDGAMVDEYAALNAHLWHVFALSQSKAATFPLVRHQFDALTGATRRPGNLADRRRLCTLVADLLQLAGEILFDSNRYTEAAHCYALSSSAAKEADAYDLWACAMTRHAFIGMYERRGQNAVSMLDLSARLARRGDHQLPTRQWVAAVQAQAWAGLGQLDACHRALEVAETVHGLTGPIHASGWLRFNGSRLAEERGACYTELGRPELAQAALTDALSQPVSARRRGAVLSDLAVTGAQQHDVELMVTYASEAVELARHTGSGYIGRKLAALRPHLVTVASDPRVRHLREQIPVLTGTNE